MPALIRLHGMANGDSVAVALSQAIRDGTIPDSDDVLSTSLPPNAVVELQKEISNAKQHLDSEIRDVSRSLAGGVDDWIARAKEVQADIARCKEDAKKIVEEHKLVRLKENEATEAAQKTELLQHEIDFTVGLQRELQSVLSITKKLYEAEQLAKEGNAKDSANILAEIRAATSEVPDGNAKSLLLDHTTTIERRLRSELETQLDKCVTVKVVQDTYTLQLHNGTNIDSLTPTLQFLDPKKKVFEPMKTRLEHFAVQSLRRKSGLGLGSYSANPSEIEVRRSTTTLSGRETLQFINKFVTTVRAGLGESGLILLNESMMKILDALIRDCLDHELPTDVNHLERIDELQKDVLATAELLQQHKLHGSNQLKQWIEGAPRTWLGKRKAETLDAVRKSFKKCTGMLHQVERTERQKANPTENSTEMHQRNEDWDASWDDGKGDEPKSDRDDEEGEDAWGFEDNDDAPAHEPETPGHDQHNGDSKPNDDAEDAWGWDDEEDNNRKGESSSKVNGTHTGRAENEEVVLTEIYMVSDIPDHIVEVLGKDISDAISLHQEAPNSLSGVKAAAGLLALPTFALAMFRATAPTQYTNFRSLGNMNLYNDSLYIADKLRNMNVPSGMNSVDSDSKAMEKFGRSAYAREMDIQRTILNDLLDGAQGFSNCTQFPYSQEIENAVSSTVDRLRAVHTIWQPILSTSALLQSVGALLSTVIGKVVTEIEEMEDISEAQSQRLVAFCGQIAMLEDLFMAKPPGTADSDENAVAMTAVYVSNWLRFQYLMNILDSSLVDLKFLWTEGELSLEFSQEEVVDLIKALFAESNHRRSAIAAIRGHRGSGIR